MDANGLRFWMLARPADWRPDAGLFYDPAARMLGLASRRVLPPLPGADAAGADTEDANRLERVPGTRDAFGTRAYWDGATAAVVATGALDDAVPIYLPPGGNQPTDLAMGYDGILYLALGGHMVLLDRRERWPPATVAAPGFAAWRLAADPAGGVWALDRTNRGLAHLQGRPLPVRPYAPYSPTTARPCEENPDPPRVTPLPSATWPATETAAGLASSPAGRLALLTWDAGGGGRVRCLAPDGMFGPATDLRGTRRPYSLAWVSESAVAVLLGGLPGEAPVYELEAGGQPVDPTGDFYPLLAHDGGPFLRGVSLPAHYPTTGRGTAPLYHLSLPTFATTGEATNAVALDSGNTGTVWHRLYLEATIPPHGGLRVYLAATDAPDMPVPDGEWYEHQFGEIFATGGTPGVPRAAWVPQPSEIAYQPGLLPCAPEPGRSGLFTVLIQRATRRVRTLRGRYLRVRLQLSGDGRTTPRVAALRAYASRFSYLTRYLPELYHENLFGPDADAVVPAGPPGSATPADFLERFLDNFEGVLTPLEDRIGSAYLLTDPRTAPEDALEWLGSWIGVGFDPAYPAARRRRLLEVAPRLFPYRGTARGLALALDVATDGAVARGDVVVLEDFRLRRTFATILGADLEPEGDPLLGGFVRSGNSYVGDTLFLGDAHQREFLALFAADLPATPAESAAVADLFDRLAYRVTVLVHQEVDPQDLGLIRRVVALETPAHVEARVLTATQAFTAGMAALVGVDTYLGRREPPRAVEIGRSRLGVDDRVEHPPSLDPRLGGGYDPAPGLDGRPRANPGPAEVVPIGESFHLDASGSRGAAGHKIVKYIWTLVE